MILAALALAFQSDPSSVILRRKDPITDQEIVAAAWGNERAGISLVCAPAQHRLRVIFTSTARPFGRTGLVTSTWKDTYRFGEARPVTIDWWHDNESSNLFEDRPITNFIREMIGAERFVMRARTFFHEEFDAIIPLHGTKAAVREVVQACGDTKVRRALGDLLDGE